MARLSPTARALLGIYIPTAVISFGQGIVIPTIPVLAAAFHLSIGLAAQIVTAQAVGRITCLIPAGLVVDRLGAKRAMVLGPASIGVGAVLTAISPSFAVVLLAQFFIGAGTTLWQLGREVSAIDIVRADQRGRLLSGIVGITTLGQAIGPVLGGVLAARLGFRDVYWIYVAVAAIVVLIALSSKEPAAQRRSPHGPLLAIGRVSEIEPYFRTTFVILLVASFIDFLFRSMLNGVLPLYLGSYLHFSTVRVGSILGFFGLVNLFMILPTGYISDKLGRKTASVPSALFLAAAFFAYPLAQTVPLLLLVTGINGIGAGLGSGSKATYTYDVIPMLARGRMQALRRMIGELGSLTGPFVGGIVADRVGPPESFLVFAPLQLISAALLLFVAKETLRARRPGTEEPTRSA